MRKVISTFLLLSTFAIMPLMPGQTMATPIAEVGVNTESSVMAPCYGGRVYRTRLTRRQRRDRLVNALVGGGIGAAIGGGIGGGRGALIGAGSGAGGYLLYRYIKDRRGRCVRQYIQRG
jgi:uncharacterized protein YcfJ